MDLKEVNEKLNTYIRPQQFPVAIKLCRSEAELPERTRLPKRDLGYKIALCQSWSMARRYGWTVARGKEDQVCPFGAVVMGFLPAKPGLLDGSFHEAGGLGSKERGAKSMEGLARLEYGQYSHLLVAPLHAATFKPDAIVIYAMPAQVGRLAQAALFYKGGTIPSVGTYGAACNRLVAATILTDECQIVVAGGGDRVMALTQDHEMAFTIPMSKLEQTIRGLEEGHRIGIARYPTLSFLQFEPRFPEGYRKIMELLQKEGT